jgi:hypothetical protein
MLPPVPLGIRAGGEPEVPRQIDDAQTGVEQSRHDRRARPVRQRREDEVGGIGDR